jgi:hypothetical protein
MGQRGCQVREPIARRSATLAPYNAVMDLIRILVVVVLIVIVLSLGSALFHLSRAGGDPQRMLRSLTWRIGLSVGLFLLLLLGWAVGLIRPHGLGG